MANIHIPTLNFSLCCLPPRPKTTALAAQIQTLMSLNCGCAPCRLQLQTARRTNAISTRHVEFKHHECKVSGLCCSAITEPPDRKLLTPAPCCRKICFGNRRKSSKYSPVTSILQSWGVIIFIIFFQKTHFVDNVPSLAGCTEAYFCQETVTANSQQQSLD